MLAARTPPSPTARTAFEVPAVLDIEASGFGPGSYPIEIGFVLGNGESYCSLIQPAAAWTHWDAQAEALHGIRRETALEHGRDPMEVARHLNTRLHGLTLYSDSWAHDYVWLNVLFEMARLSPSFRLENLRALLTDAQAERWGSVKTLVAIDMNLKRHRASADALVLQQTLVRLRGPLPKRRRAKR